MELLDRIIYADETGKELGILRDFDIDVDVAGQKDFEIKMDSHISPLKAGYYWFVQGYEYGGVIDVVEGDSANDEITFTGRNARGILNSRIVMPPSRQSHRVVSGAIFDVFNELIQLCDLTELFIADIAEGEQLAYNVQLDRFCTLYEAMEKVCASANSTMKLAYSSTDRKWHVMTQLTRDYSDYLNYCRENSLSFETTIKKNAVNHLVCLGDGEMEERFVIHLFTNENGGLQPYKKVENPVEDSDYILDTRNQVIFGRDEYAEVYDGSTEAVTNYVLLNAEPPNWANDFAQYFYLKQETDQETNEITEIFENYEIVESEESEYRLLTSKPSNWDEEYSSYYYRKIVMVGYEYESVSSVTDEPSVSTMKLLTRQPDNWVTDYSSYYVKVWDGIAWRFDSVTGLSWEDWVMTTAEPSDWEENYTSYYYLDTEHTGQFQPVDGVEETTPPYHTVAPPWRKNKYFMRKQVSQTREPLWEPNKYYWYDAVEHAPTWEANKYYEAYTVYSTPPYVQGNTYRAAIDNYAKLVDDGIKRLDEIRASDEQSVNLDEFEVDIGDVVGGVDDVTGYIICEPVTNVIAKLDINGINVEYVVGGNQNGA